MKTLKWRDVPSFPVSETHRSGLGGKGKKVEIHERWPTLVIHSGSVRRERARAGRSACRWGLADGQRASLELFLTNPDALSEKDQGKKSIFTIMLPRICSYCGSHRLARGLL